MGGLCLRRELGARLTHPLSGGVVQASGALSYTVRGATPVNALEAQPCVDSARVAGERVELELDRAWLAARVDQLLADARDGVPGVEGAPERFVLVSEALAPGGAVDWGVFRAALRLDVLARVLRFAGHEVSIDHAPRHPLASYGALAAAHDPSASADAHAARLAHLESAAVSAYEHLRAETDRALTTALGAWRIERDGPYGATSDPTLVLETLASLEEDECAKRGPDAALRVGDHVLRDARGATTRLACDVSALLTRWMHFHATRVVRVGAPSAADADEAGALAALGIEDLRIDCAPLAPAPPSADVTSLWGSDERARAALVHALKYADLRGAPIDASLVGAWESGPLDLARRIARRRASGSGVSSADAGATPALEGPARRLAVVLVTFPDAVMDAAEALDPAPLCFEHLGALGAAYRAYDDSLGAATHDAAAERLTLATRRQLARSAALLAILPEAEL